MSKAMKIFFSICGVIFSLLVLLVLLLPKIISSDTGKNFIIGTVNDSINGEISVEKISVEWMGGQLVEGVSLKGENGEEVATLELLSTSQPLWDILLNGFTVTQSRLQELNARIIPYDSGMTNLQHALSKGKISPGIPLPGATIILKDVNGLVHASEDGETITSELSGKTEQGSLKGEFSLEGNLLLSTPKVLSGVDDLNLVLNVKNFPVAFIDSLVSIQNPQMNGVLSALIGKSLNATITEQQNGGTASTHWIIDSPNFQLHLDGNLDVNGFSLSKPAVATLQVTPDLISRLENNQLLKKSLQLKNAAELKVVLNDLSFPFQTSSKKEVGVDIEFNFSEVEIAGDTLSKNLILEKIEGHLVAPLKSEQATVHFVGKAGDRGEDRFEMTVDATIDKPENLDDFINNLKENAKINIEARGFPSLLFDVFAGDDYSFGDVIGEHLELSVGGELKRGRGFFSASLRSDNINLQDANFSLDQNLTLDQPVKLSFILTPKAFKSFYPGELVLRDPAHFQFLFDEFSFPVTDGELSSAISMDAKLIAMGEVQFDSEENGTFFLENSSIHLSGSSSDAVQLALSAGIVTHENSGRSWEILGASTQVGLSAKFQVTPSHHLRMTDAKAQVKGSNLQLEVNGNIQDGEFSLSAPVTMHYVMTPSMLESLFPKLSGVQHIEDDIPLVITIATEKPSMRLGTLKDIELSGHVSVPLLPFKFGDKKITLRDIMIPWEFDGGDKRAKLSLSGASYVPGNSNKGTFKGKLTLKDWVEGNLLDTATYKMRLDLINFPTETLNVVDDTHSLSTLMGNTIQAEIDVEFNDDGESECDLLVEGDEFFFRAALAVNHAISIKDPSDPVTMKMKLTPQRFSVISKILRPNPKNPLELIGDSAVELTLDHLNIPVTKSEYSIPLWNAGINGSFTLDKMLILDKRRNRKLPFDKVHVRIDTKDLSSSLAFQLTTSDGNGDERGKLSIDGTVKEAFKRSGELNIEGLAMDGTVVADELQTEAFCQLFCPYPTMADKVQALIGDPVSADIAVHIRKMDGPIKGTLQGTNGHATLDASVRNGYLMLNKPFVAQVKATPELGQAVMREIAPFLSGLQESSQPITLHIDPKGFAFPIQAFDRSKISIGLCSLNMGRMVFQNSGQMQAILGLLGSSAADTIPIWVTPLYVRMHDGKVKLERVDMLLNNRFPIAAWGGVDLIKEKVNMVIGITGYALATAMNIQSISSDYMLQVPLKGPLSNPKLDKKKAAAKISALVAQDHGTEGMVIGTVLDIASGGLTESAPPQPTTQPLPWANQLPQRQEPTAVKESPEVQIIESSKDKVKEGAQKLFKKIFK